MLSLQRLRSDHAASVLAFEVANRGYFAASIADRGDEFFEAFDDGFDELLTEQAAGTCAFHVLVDEGGAVAGRFNLYDLDDATAVVGYRMAQGAAGRGVATSTLRELCRLAAEQYGVTTLRAVVSEENLASRRVLEKAGFGVVGPTEVAGRPGTLYELCTDRTAPREEP